MANDAQIKSFVDGRAGLRDTAKWLISGVAGAAAVLVGASSVSQLGSLDVGHWRFWLAVLSLAGAAGLAWLTFVQAVDVLRNEILTLKEFASAAGGDLKAAIDRVDKLMRGQFGKDAEGKPRSLRTFVNDIDQLREKAWNPADEKGSQAAVADLDERFDVARQACVSALISVRFDRLVGTIRNWGWILLAALLMFAWAANPAKEDGKSPAPSTEVSVTISPTPAPIAGEGNSGRTADLPRATVERREPIVLLGWVCLGLGLFLFMARDPLGRFFAGLGPAPPKAPTSG